MAWEYEAFVKICPPKQKTKFAQFMYLTVSVAIIVGVACKCRRNKRIMLLASGLLTIEDC
jgi:hypothetical protein